MNRGPAMSEPAHAANPTAENRRFRDACGRFATGVTVISAVTDGGIRGMTANGFMSVSLNPRLVAISVAQSAKMHAILTQESEQFAISLLSSGQIGIADQFAGRPSVARVQWQHVDDRCEVIAGSLAWFACHTVQRVDAGDHTVLIGEVRQFAVAEAREPLVFYSGKYHRQLRESIEVDLDWLY